MSDVETSSEETNSNDFIFPPNLRQCKTTIQGVHNDLGGFYQASEQMVKK